jgi:hypothetical protein
VTGLGGPGSQEHTSTPSRRIGPYEQSLLESRDRIQAAAHRRRRTLRRRRVLAVVTTLAVLGGAAYGGWTVLSTREGTLPTSSPAARPASCAVPKPVRVAVAPVIAPAVAAATQALGGHAEGPCASYTIEPAESFAVAGSLVSGRPDAWIMDSTQWLDRAAAASGSRVETGQPFASSPLVVAMPDQAVASLGDRHGWADLLGGATTVRIPDPSRSVTGQLALGQASTTMPDPKLRTIIAAAAKTSSTTISLDDLAVGKQPGSAVVTEAQLSAFNAAHPGSALAAVAPAEGSGALQFSMATLTRDEKVVPLVQALGAYLRSDEARKVLQDNGFHTPDGKGPKPLSPLYGEIRVSDAPPYAAVAKTANLWNEAAPKVQALLAVDVSGSMLERGKNGTRLSIVQRSVVRATAEASPTTAAALWIYSNHIGPRADDYKQLVDYGWFSVTNTIGTIDRQVSGLDKAVGGGSGLYDTIAAAYDRASSAWRSGYTNTVVIVADGPNEDDYGLTLDLLKKHLAAAKNASRPVRLVVLGLGDRADAKAMRQVVAITDGEYVPTQTVDDLGPALTRALGG